MSATASPVIPPARRRARPVVDRVRVTLPVEVHGDADVGRRFARFLAEHLPDGYDVRYRRDQGIVLRVDWQRPTGRGASPAGAVHAAAGVLAGLETALERIGRRSASHATALEAVLPRMTLTTRPSR